MRLNLRCGDALLGPDFTSMPAQVAPTANDWLVADLQSAAGLQIQRELYPGLSRHEHIEVEFGNPPIHWARDFSVAAQQGGFDVIVGNPPYVSFYAREAIKPSAAVEDYLAQRFAASVGGRGNTFLYFLALALSLRAPTGYVGMIVPDTLITNASYAPMRRALLANGLRSLDKLDFSVFPDATVRIVIPIVGPGDAAPHLRVYPHPTSFSAQQPRHAIQASHARLTQTAASGWSFGDSANQAIVDKMRTHGIPLECLAETRDGINPGPRGFRTQLLNPPGAARRTWRPVIEGRHITPYIILPTDEVVDYDPDLITSDLKRRGASLRQARIFDAPKLVSRQTADSLIFALDTLGVCTLNSVHCTRALDGQRSTLLFLLGLLNSRLLRFYYRHTSQETRVVFPQVHIAALRQLPMPPAPMTLADQARRDTMVGLVEDMLRYRQEAGSPSTDNTANVQSKSDAVQHHIDSLVYESYDLSQSEVEVVNGPN